MTDWNKIREDFPITKNIVYFQSAAMSPIPTPVFNKLIDNYRTIHETGDIYWDDDVDEYKKLCAEIAGLLNTKKSHITFTQNTSIIMALLALTFKQQISIPFNIISMEDEFPASTIGFEHQGIDMRYVKPDQARYSIESILEKIDENTLAVITSYIQYATGFRQNLQALGKELKERDILFVVNATQAFPFFPIDVNTMNIDVLAASLHKWGMTGHIGALFYTSPSFRKKFPPPFIGWLSVAPEGEDFIHTAKNQPFKLRDSAHCYDFGTSNLQPVLAFKTALEYMQNIGFENIWNRILELSDYLIYGLNKLGIQIISPVAPVGDRSAILSFTLADKNQDYIKLLEEKKIYVSARGGCIRVSLNIFNNISDIDLLLHTLEEIL